jgi:RsiW-degrading membrane proteinase PrsW (M82 family)
MDILLIILFSFLPALIYASIIYFTVPYKTIDFRIGLNYLVGGFLSVGLLIYFFSVFPSWVNLTDFFFDPKKYPLHYLHFRNFIQIGLIEESFKLLTFFIVEEYRNTRKVGSDHPLATMFYVGMVSLGFAVIENVQYASNSITPLDTLFWRSVTAVIGHMVFGLFMGYWISLGRLKPRLKNRSLIDIIVLKRDKLKRRFFVVVGLLAATVLHGLYDLHIGIMGSTGITMLYMLLIMSLLGVFWCFRNIVKVYNQNP